MVSERVSCTHLSAIPVVFDKCSRSLRNFTNPYYEPSSFEVRVMEENDTDVSCERGCRWWKNPDWEARCAKAVRNDRDYEADQRPA